MFEPGAKSLRSDRTSWTICPVREIGLIRVALVVLAGTLALTQVVPAAEIEERLVEFLVDKQKVYCSRVALYRAQHTVTPPAGLASNVFFCPRLAHNEFMFIEHF